MEFDMDKKKRSFNSTRLVVLSFGVIILTGTLLLMLPIASRSGQCCGLMTALFTATSATCVTGLILVDTLTSWTLFGQVVILLMIQLGGLGFMTVITLFSLALHRRITLSERLVMVSTLNLNDLDGVVRLVKDALFSTFVIEGSGAVILSACFIPRFGFWKGLWRGIFTSVSAMCNAGFDLMGPKGGGSLSTYNDNPVVLLTVAALIAVGGLGFFVWEDIQNNFRNPRKLSLYSKMVLVMTAALIVIGTVFILGAEYYNPDTLGKMPFWQKLLNSVFQSVTLRTAGFNAIPQGALVDSSKVVSTLFMLIGGSSGSTAGGVKTVTVAVLLLMLRAGVRGDDDVTVHGRSFPVSRTINALTLVLMVGMVFLVSSIAVTLMEPCGYLDAAFEVASAMGTVGLTTGITPGLGVVSHSLLIVLMFLGRVGILSFSFIFLTSSAQKSKVQYPTFNILIG